MSRLVGRLLVVLAISWAGSANAALIVNPTGGFGAPCGSCDPGGSTFGWAFTVVSAITVDGLGIWDYGADGIDQDVSAGLWIDGGDLLAFAVITNSSSLEFSTSEGGWRFEDFASVLLTPGNYVVGFTAFPNSPTARVFAGITTIPEVIYGGARNSFLIGPGLIRPDGRTAIPVDVFGVNLRTAAVPVPGPVYLVVMALAALGLSRKIVG